MRKVLERGFCSTIMMARKGSGAGISAAASSGSGSGSGSGSSSMSPSREVRSAFDFEYEFWTDSGREFELSHLLRGETGNGNNNHHSGVRVAPFSWGGVCGGEEEEEAVDSIDASTAESALPRRFRAKEFGAALETQILGKTFLYGSTMDSTQTFVMNALENVDDGFTCLADVQTMGKGRGGNTWTSPLGCLMCTFVTLFDDGRTLPFVQYLVSLAILRAIKSLIDPELPVHIKWPNDLYYDRTVKIGGILCQSSYSEGKYRVAVGFGVNVTNAEPTVSLNSIAGELNVSSGGEASKVKASRVCRETLLARTLNEFEVLREQFISAGSTFAPFKAEYEESWLHSGQRVSVVIEDGRRVDVAVVGLAPSGCLRAVNPANGELYDLTPDGNSFNFFEGLITRKANLSETWRG